jgi:hypothetical protein
VLNSGLPIEVHASKIYTPNVFGLFQIHLFQSGSYIVREVIDGHKFMVKHVFSERRQKWSRTEYEVTADPEIGYFKCECGMYEHMGVLCGHALRVSELSNLWHNLHQHPVDYVTFRDTD